MCRPAGPGRWRPRGKQFKVVRQDRGDTSLLRVVLGNMWIQIPASVRAASSCRKVAHARDDISVRPRLLAASRLDQRHPEMVVDLRAFRAFPWARWSISSALPRPLLVPDPPRVSWTADPRAALQRTLGQRERLVQVRADAARSHRRTAKSFAAGQNPAAFAAPLRRPPPLRVSPSRSASASSRYVSMPSGFAARACGTPLRLSGTPSVRYRPARGVPGEGVVAVASHVRLARRTAAAARPAACRAGPARKEGAVPGIGVDRLFELGRCTLPVPRLM